MSASGLNIEDETRQVSMLLYCLGEEAEDVIVSTNIKDTSRKRYAGEMAKLNGYFKVWRNLIFKRVKSNQRNQREGELPEEYITKLYALIKMCEFNELRNEMLQDRPIVGIRDKGLSEKLQLDTDLTLKKVLTSI